MSRRRVTTLVSVSLSADKCKWPHFIHSATYSWWLLCVRHPRGGGEPGVLIDAALSSMKRFTSAALLKDDLTVVVVGVD